MKRQGHSLISLLAGSGTEALSDFEHEGEESGSSSLSCVAVCPVFSSAALDLPTGMSLVRPVTSVMKPCMATALPA